MGVFSSKDFFLNKEYPVFVNASLCVSLKKMRESDYFLRCIVLNDLALVNPTDGAILAEHHGAAGQGLLILGVAHAESWNIRDRVI